VPQALVGIFFFSFLPKPNKPNNNKKKNAPGSFHLIRLYYEEFLNLLVDRQYTAMKKHELDSKFPVNFFSVIHPSIAIMLDHTSYFKQDSPSPIPTGFRPMSHAEAIIPEPLQLSGHAELQSGCFF